MQLSAPRSIHLNRFLRVVLLLALVSFLTGCSAVKPGGHLDLYSETTHHFYSENFKEAWYASSHEGEWDIVLVNDPVYQEYIAHPTGPLLPTTGQPIQQVVHIQVLWKPLRGTEGHTPAVINSTIEWYVFGSKGEQLDMLRYGGAALTSLDFKLTRASIDFRDGSFEIPQRIGGISDPIGAAGFTGHALALKNPQRVDEVLRAVQDQSTAASARTRLDASPPAPPPSP